MTAKQLAQHLGKSLPTTYRLIATGAFLSVKVGGTWLIDPQSVRTWLESRTVRPSTRTT